jgi:prepilin-type processing-associated H-X9-DG protein/prepilin-type N-terminal cleavage/methylation domain-containing protein
MDNCGPRRAGRVKAGFTLIELLVVVGTISVLIAILLPALASAKETAKRTACGANLHQVSIAIHGYANDWNQKIPFGAKAPPAITAANLYPATGNPTSLISALGGTPCGVGLLMKEYLGSTPKVVFCPGSEQKDDSDKQLALFGTAQSQSSYYYRHGSVNAMTDSPAAIATWDLHNKLTDLGLNSNNEPIRALMIDTQFPLSGLESFGIVPRTHHQKKWVNVLYADGHVSASPNTNNRYVLDLSDPMATLKPFALILKVFEAADSEQ